MGDQTSFASMAWSRKGKVTRRERFLAEMDALIPWPQRIAVVEPHYPNEGGPGRPAHDPQRMLRIYFLQQWFNLSDPQAEDARCRQGRKRGTARCSWPVLLPTYDPNEANRSLVASRGRIC